MRRLTRSLFRQSETISHVAALCAVRLPLLRTMATFLDDFVIVLVNSSVPDRLSGHILHISHACSNPTCASPGGRRPGDFHGLQAQSNQRSFVRRRIASANAPLPNNQPLSSGFHLGIDQARVLNMELRVYKLCIILRFNFPRTSGVRCIARLVNFLKFLVEAFREYEWVRIHHQVLVPREQTITREIQGSGVT